MTGIAYLVEAFAEGDLLRPRPEVRNLVDMSRALANLCGVNGLELSENAQAISKSIGDADHIVLVLVDGMGMNLLESLPTQFVSTPAPLGTDADGVSIHHRCCAHVPHYRRMAARPCCHGMVDTPSRSWSFGYNSQLHSAEQQSESSE